MKAQETVLRIAEGVVADDDVRRDRAVVVKHQVAAVGIGALAVAPAAAGIDAGVVLEDNVARATGGTAIPEFEGVFTVPDDVAPIGDVLLDVGAVALVGQRGTVDFPEAAILHETVARAGPELDAVAEANGLAIRAGGLVTAADAVRGAVAEIEVLVGHPTTLIGTLTPRP